MDTPIAREPLDLAPIEALLGRLSGVDPQLADWVPALVAELRDLRATRDRRHLLGIIERLRAERDGLAAQLGEATIKTVVTGGPVIQIADDVWTHGTRLGRDHHSVRRHLIEDHGLTAERIAAMSDGAIHGEHDGQHKQTWAYAVDLPHPLRHADPDDPDTPEAVERELQRLAAETGEPIETVRAAYRVCGKAGESGE